MTSAALTSSASAAIEAQLWRCLEGVADPEIPVLSIVDLGIVRHVGIDAHGTVEVGLSPTYSGCPATAVIKAQVAHALQAHGWPHARIVDVLAPAWSTDWISAEGRRKLHEYGIAPPVRGPVACPRCGSEDTRQLSEFGSTPCKALYRCTKCLEPFDHFKCL
ncbi:MAG: putative 1,2-phenylacetyl-CoA epoxidase, subunit D [Steroidobacteraceae bacterium]|nr:putative 1,2-phenylacetyl-CoA epoxidase, subunit D [Steroidobacteraceae bacterium]